MRWILILLVGLPVLFVGGIFAASEYGGEVVVLRTEDAAGEVHETHLWIVEDEGQVYLRAGQQTSGWCQRLLKIPEIELTRAGQTRTYRAELAPDRSSRVGALMAEKYGFADRLIDSVRDPEATVAVRLRPSGS